MRIFSIVLSLFCFVTSQENAGHNVAESLIECYNSSQFENQDNRLPATINVLIELIRRVENGRSEQDARKFAIELIHLLRQDGIRKVRTSNPKSLPYSPKGFQIYKYRLLLEQFIPGNAINFPNETLSILEKCSLHYMLSNSFELRSRDDEDKMCKNLSNMQRNSRSVGNKVVGEAEIIKQVVGEKGNLVEESVQPDKEDIEENAVPRGFDSKQEISECPVENGVIFTKWGAIQAGTIIGAIAAASENQQTEENGYTVDSIFASTLASDIAEVALQQGTARNSYDVGFGGGWNSTVMPKWYFVRGMKGFEMTDAEIRANLDGLIIAKNIEEWRKKYASLKISQILDMYYSERGVFSGTKACNRNKLATTYAKKDELKAQVLGFAYKYDKIATFDGTVSKDTIKQFVDIAVTNYLNYYPRLAGGLCENTEDIRRVAADIIIVLDTDWPYQNVLAGLSYLLDNIDVNQYETSFIIINGQDGQTIIERSNNILDLHEKLNYTIYSNQPKGFDPTKSFASVKIILDTTANDDKTKSNIGGRSPVVLFVPHIKSIGHDTAALYQDMQNLKKNQPGIKFLVWGTGDKGGYIPLADEEDCINFYEGSDQLMPLTESVTKVIDKIKAVHRIIKNPSCGVSMTGPIGSSKIDLYVEPGSTNYYKIPKDYLLHGSEVTPTVKVKGQFGAIIVCGSKSEPKPNRNNTKENCKSINSNEESFSLGSGSDFYLSVEAELIQSVYRCTDKGCRFPDNAKFTLSVEGMGCNTENSSKGLHVPSGSHKILIGLVIYLFIFNLAYFVAS